MRLGLASVLLGALILLLTPAAAVAAGCDGSGWIDHCTVTNSGSQVDIGASMTAPRDETRSDTSPNSSRPDAPRINPGTSSSAAAECNPVVDCRPIYQVVSPPEVTLADLASFRPATPTLTGQPRGFGVVGMPANIVAAASEQQMAGTILGWDVTVRFVPAGFVFDYGDGATARTRTGGASWEQLGQAQFTPTSTSHAYRARGTYPVSVTVQYAPSVDFGGGWRTVPGFVSASAGGYEVQVVEVRTALVDRTCAENPSGPGC